MILLANLSCSTEKAEKAAYEFCLEALQSGVDIYRLFFSGSIVKSALKPNSAWLKLCQANNINGVCCSHSVEQYKEVLSADPLDTKKLSESKIPLNNHQNESGPPVIEPGGLALLVEGAVKSDLIVNFNDTSYSTGDAFEQIKNIKVEHSGTNKKNTEEYILRLSVSVNTDNPISGSENYQDQRIQRLMDSAAIFLVFEQKFNILLDISTLNSLNKEKLIENIKTLAELGLKKINFCSISELKTSDKPINVSLLESLSVLMAELKLAGIECETYPSSHYKSLNGKHITF